MSLAAQAYISDQDVRTVSSKKGGELFGQTASTSDGRVYAYGLNGTGSGTALAPGKLCQGAVSVSNHVNQTGTVNAVGVRTLSYTIGATAITANQYQDGYFYVNSGTTTQTLLVDNTNAASSGGTVTVNLKDNLAVATTASSKFSLQPNPWSAAIIAAHGSATSVIPTGVPNVSIPDTDFGWFQVGGPCAVLANGTPAVGVAVIPGATTDGSVDVATGAITQGFVGYCLITAVSTEYRMINLTINA